MLIIIYCGCLNHRRLNTHFRQRQNELANKQTKKKYRHTGCLFKINLLRKFAQLPHQREEKKRTEYSPENKLTKIKSANELVRNTIICLVLLDFINGQEAKKTHSLGIHFDSVYMTNLSPQICCARQNDVKSCGYYHFMNGEYSMIEICYSFHRLGAYRPNHTQRSLFFARSLAWENLKICCRNGNEIAQLVWFNAFSVWLFLMRLNHFNIYSMIHDSAEKILEQF